ncbi:MAG: glycosyltransferase family protein [Planctomycetes bacterium]|nr:glycosyltransferase family protein [Planctomycetota bacterium]
MSGFVVALARGAAHLDAGEFDQAEKVYEQIVRADPQHAPAWHQLGLVALQQHDLERAVECLERAVSLDNSDPTYQIDLGRVHSRLDQTDEAIECFQQAIFLAPDDPRPHELLGNVLHHRGDFIGAELQFEQVVRLDPQAVSAWSNLGTLHTQLGRHLEAISCFREALKHQPDRRDDWLHLTALLFDQFRAMDSGALRRTLGEIDPFALNAPANLALIQAIHTALHQAKARASAGKPHAVLPPPHFPFGSMLEGHPPAVADSVLTTPPLSGPIRIGFLSRCLSDHAIGELTRGLLRQISRNEFFITAFVVGDAEPQSTLALRDAVDALVELPTDLPTARAAITATRPEVLVFTDLGLDLQTTTLAHSRLAPVQCALWGRPLGTRLSTIDYILSSQLFAVAGISSRETRKLTLLESLGVYYERPAIDRAESRDDVRREFGLPRRKHLYLCPQPVFLLEPEFDIVLRALLERDVSARVVLIESACAAWNEKLSVRLREHLGPLADRVIFTPPVDRDQLLRLMRVVDVMLDPPHFGGGLTSFQALGQGLPIVTLPAPLPYDQVTAGCYRKMRLEVCVVRTLQEYVDVAVRLGTEPGFNASMRTEITNRNSAVIADAAAVQDLEQFFRRVARPATPAPLSQPSAA